MNNRNVLFVWTGLFAAVAVLCSGCGGQRLPSDLPKLYPTVITVIQDGNPLAGALVTMINVDKSVGWSCVAMTDASGRATMVTNGMYAGTPEGTYKVTVSKHETETSGADALQALYATAPDPSDFEAHQGWLMRNEARIAAAQARQTAVVYTLVDPVFTDVDTTTLEVTITPGGRNANQHTLDVGAAIRTVHRERIR
jgi:hypothetical protein